MRLPTLRPWPPVLPAGEDTYQEFVAGTIPVTRLVTDSNEVLVLVGSDAEDAVHALLISATEEGAGPP